MNWLYTGKPLGEHIENDSRNNFRLIRLIAALMVLETHSHLMPGEEKNHYADSFHISYLGLPSFFFLSGLLVTQSLYKSSSWKNFLWKRLLRIYPSACLSVLLAAWIMGPFVTSFDLKTYFSSPTLYQYLLTCSLLHINFLLPGVFSHSVLNTAAVNASLWTISMELKLYMGLLAVWMAKIPGKRKLLAVLIATLVTAYFFSGEIPVSQHLSPYLTYGVQFLNGVFCYLHKDKIIPRGFWLLLLPLAFAASLWLDIFSFTAYLLIPALIIFAATHGVSYLKKITPRADLSYGIYVFAFPVQQLVANYLHPAGPFMLFILSVIAVSPLAILSWYGVEKRALLLKGRIR
jgi:peptidoglycan/LPS O-acetylase OafA/YrhL